ncbi:toprim domain-containing protein [Gilliamella sp. B14384G15]|uniref:primase-helicase zinc-binding domain-containing protein n=1 Tax=unclassified Gilliamella TaxID=2685620 RepID=UPI0018DD87F4|nr:MULTISPECIES: primase-helicase zinc-binding domain-containing protein [unclassified Gilliamella]MBI0031680.1 toprim domain-containing protein [Gilliamella sp. B14384G15]MBI0059035.1 toprim domain-containing protein [Gilliamella sp. B14384G12]
MKINEITSQAVDKWQSIFSSLGIVVGNGKHCPCPVCGGKDRFRFDNQNGRGTYICNQCGSGDGLELIKNYCQCDAKEASNKVAECLNLSNQNNQIRENLVFRKIDSEQLHNDNMPDNPVCKKVEYLLSKATLGQSQYLTKKGLTFDLPLLDNGRIFVPILNLHNEYAGGQFIEPDGSKHLMKSSNKKGAFIWVSPNLGKPDEVNKELLTATEIIICEGLATGISIAVFRHRSPVISAIDAGNLIHVAKGIRELNPTAKIIIAGDNDIGQSPNTGLAKAIEASQAVNGYYSVPDTDYKCDWDDYRQQFGLEKVKQYFDSNIKNSLKGSFSEIKLKSIPDLSQMQASQKADVLIEHYENNLSLDMVTNEVYIYKDNVWQMISEMDLKRELVQLFRQSNAHYSEKGIKSTIDTMKLQIPLKNEPARNLIGFKNGVFDLDTRTFKSHSKNHWLQSINNVDFIDSVSNENLEHHAPNFYQWLSRSAKKDTIKMDAIKAALYMILANRYDWQLFLEVTGAGGSGKSVFAEIATMLAGKNNTVSANMEALEKPRERSLIVGQSLIILPDQAKYIGEGNGIKAITGGDDVAIDEKYKKPYSTKIQGVILAINNNPMTFSNDDGGISRRRVIFHFGEPVPANERDPNLKDKISAELSVIIRHLFNYFKDDSKAKSLLIKQQKSSEAIEVKRLTNPLIDFCSYLFATDKPDGMMIGKYSTPIQFKRFLYHAYITFIENNNLKNPLSLRNFVNALPSAMKEYDVEVIIRARHSEGRRTNLHLDYDKCNDWFPDAALEENNINYNKR